MLKGSPTLKAALSEALRASRRGTGGVDDCGTTEEDDPVTWETPDCPVGRSGRRRTGDPLRRAVGSKRTDGRHHDGSVVAHRTNVCATGKARPRANRRRGEAAGESDGRIGATMVGNGLGTRTQRSKGGQC
jgi:hypothetical protein